ncbi:MAG: BLUF domain-containing protein [Pseudomonadota bacterium]
MDDREIGYQTSTMIQLAYTSTAVKPMSEIELIQLLQQARKFNTENDITGLLLYKEQSFFQVIEGERDVVNELLLTILDDTRHCDLGVIYNREIAIRDFTTWSMGFVNLESDDYDLDDWNREGFQFPLQNLTGDLTQMISVRQASHLVRSFSQRV